MRQEPSTEECLHGRTSRGVSTEGRAEASQSRRASSGSEKRPRAGMTEQNLGTIHLSTQEVLDVALAAVAARKGKSQANAVDLFVPSESELSDEDNPFL